ncbi:hypothetical protein MA16_Dca006618 [Dendrobium catenatum]|uniref:Transposase-associated domain-containing protein n=1 Tax=Dendrobium catenatum TaxID=906689 RepID=A0A2I0X5L6_9ASPA|nr:hypothetical protein MA16_Dca006618 [Dendrobium catenatum]
MNKSWITKSRWSREYNKGVEDFLNFASRSKNLSGKILCPCKSCINRYFHSIQDVKEHIMTNGFFTGYVIWNRHGQSKLLEDVGAELYPGCKRFSKLSFILHLFRLKCLNSWTARSFDMLLELLIEAFPEGISLPKTTYEVKKLMDAFDLGYTKIHACTNDCTLFWGDKSNDNACEVCGASRWTPNQKSKIAQEKKVQMKHAKILRLFVVAESSKKCEKCKKKTKVSAYNGSGELSKKTRRNGM